ncbi:MAG: FkbM family methyltransferase [Opitutales bacterium]|nr:FkbM family methyltransferase [Opitutales bacterium]
MRFSRKNIKFALRHPVRTLKYLRNGAHIPLQQIERFLPPDPVVLEAGAHNGNNTAEIALFWPEALIHAFEPVPSIQAKLAEKTQPFGNRIKIYPVGLGSEEGTLKMNLSGGEDADTQSSSFLRPLEAAQKKEFSFLRFERSISVPVTTIDSWALHQGVEKIDLLWLDLQGYELNALRAGERMLKKATALHLEVSLVQLYEGAPLYSDIVDWLLKRGFRPKIEAIFRVGGNVLFVRE